MIRFFVALALAIGAQLQAAEKPNIVWIIGDDLGAELGCYGYKGVRTPHLDKLASQGTRFTAAFATSPVCSSSRSAFMTGRYQTSIGAHHHRTMKKKPLREDVHPITHHLRKAGYQCISHRDHGANGKVDCNFTTPNEKMFDDTIIKGDAPFFLYVNFKEPHRKFKSPGNPEAKFKLPPQYPDHPEIRADWAAYLAEVEAFDAKVGNFLKWLEDEGLTENTIIFLFGDHGRPHVWGKQWLYEGGIRVPLIVRWPGVVKAAAVDDRLVSLLDVSKQTVYMACAAAQIEMPGGFHGHAFLAENAPRHDYVVAARDRCGDAYDRIRCVRTKRFKYIRNFYPELPYWQTSRYKEVSYPAMRILKELHTKGELTAAQVRFFEARKPAEELYDLEADPHETTNLAAPPKYAKKLVEMRAHLTEWIDDRGDDGAVPETVAEYERAENASKKGFAKKFKPDEWHSRSEMIRKALKKRNMRPESP